MSGPAGTVAIRSGLTSGEVILMEGDDYIGHCVNVAARLCDLARGGEALAAPSVMTDLPPWAVTVGTRDMEIRGVEKPVNVSVIGIATPGPDRASDPICGLPVSEATAEERAAGVGGPVLFCSLSCLDTWRRRPAGSASTG